MRIAELPACTDCGACCHYGHTPPYSASEISLLPVRIRRKIMALRVPGNNTLGQRCAFLGADGLCIHYDDRPEACRNFERGGQRCLELVG